MLISILFRVLVFVLAFGVGVGSEALFGGPQDLPNIQIFRPMDPPIMIKFEGMDFDQNGRPFLCYSLCNNSSHSIWFYQVINTPDYHSQQWINNHWVSIRRRSCFSAHFSELKPKSQFKFAASPNWYPQPQRIGIMIFWENPFQSIEKMRSTPFPEPNSWIWSAPFKIQYYQQLRSPVDQNSPKNQELESHR